MVLCDLVTEMEKLSPRVTLERRFKKLSKSSLDQEKKENFPGSGKIATTLWWKIARSMSEL